MQARRFVHVENLISDSILVWDRLIRAREFVAVEGQRHIPLV